MVFIDPPTQYNKVYAHILDTSIDYKPIHLPSRAVIVIDDFQVRSMKTPIHACMISLPSCIDHYRYRVQWSTHYFYQDVPRKIGCDACG